jgi:hypothetical protein
MRKNEEQYEYHCEKAEYELRKQPEPATTATQASEVKQKMLDKMMKGLKYRSD